MMKCVWVNFYLGDRFLAGYTIEGTFAGEMKATMELLAYENNCKVEDITVKFERR